MEEGAEDRRKRLRAMATDAAAVGQNEIPLAAVPLPASALPNPLATTVPHRQPPPPPYPPGLPQRPNWEQQHHEEAYPSSFGRGGGRRGGGRGGRGRGRHPERGHVGRSGRGGGRGRGRGNAPSATNIEAYFSPQMLSNPWSHLEQRQQQLPTSGPDNYEAEEGKFDTEGIHDRPWH